MTYSGRVKNGVIVLEGQASLPEGTAVAVEPLKEDQARPKPGTPQAILSNPAQWRGDPQEADHLLEELRKQKQAEVQAELKRWINQTE